MPDVVELFLRVAGPNPVVQGLVGGLIITGFNMVGALAILMWRHPTERSLDVALAFAAGVMLTASFTSLILPGIEVGGLWPVVVGIVLGALVLDRADVWVPHIHVLVTGRRRTGAAPGGAGDPRHDDRRPRHAGARRGAGLTCGSSRRRPDGAPAAGSAITMNSVCAPAESSMKSVALMMPYHAVVEVVRDVVPLAITSWS